MIILQLRQAQWLRHIQNCQCNLILYTQLLLWHTTKKRKNNQLCLLVSRVYQWMVLPYPAESRKAILEKKQSCRASPRIIWWWSSRWWWRVTMNKKTTDSSFNLYRKKIDTGEMSEQVIYNKWRKRKTMHTCATEKC